MPPRSDKRDKKQKAPAVEDQSQEAQATKKSTGDISITQQSACTSVLRKKLTSLNKYTCIHSHTLIIATRKETVFRHP